VVGDLRQWYQQEFDFDFSIPKKKKKKVDYKLIISELQKGPLTFSQIQALAGVSRAGVSQVITTLSLHYPLYEAARGIYKLYGDDDYGDGINRAALQEYEDEW
jgi:hypothetical protein